jgi:predicted lipid-binding transport protein (Tim44 family)
MSGAFSHERGEQLAEKALELESVEHHPEEAFEQMVKDRPSPVGAGVDLGPVKALDPTFDEMTFVGVVHESYYLLREARTKHDVQDASDLAEPAIEQELEKEISDDAAAHRWHVLAGDEIRSTTITNAAVDGRLISLTVRLHITSKDNVVGDRGQLLDGDDQWHDWDEDWTFSKNLDADESAEDQKHALLPDHHGHWDFAHQGWNIHAVTRV